MINERKKLLDKFINDNIKDVKEIIPQKSDASFRVYSRVVTKDGSFMVMDSPPDKEPIDLFIKIGKHLIEQGFNAPKLLKIDSENGFLLLEDFGDNTFINLIKNGYDSKKLYSLATDLLIDLHKSPFITSLAVNPYDIPLYLKEVKILSDWYIPYYYGEMSLEKKSEWEKAWLKVLGELPMMRSTLVLRDYHSGNIMLLKDDKCGLLDFQDALIGSPAYDLMSLLEDVRLDVDKNVMKNSYEYYKKSMNYGEEFDKSYQIVAAQRHAKILGIFVRLSVRDNKDRYLKLLPRSLSLFEKSLKSPYLLPVKEFLERNYPNFFTEKPVKHTIESI